MQTVSGVAGPSALGCAKLGEMGLVNTLGCCERCHSADVYVSVGSLGPCRAALPDGTVSFVCCESKKRLLGLQ